MCLGGKGESGVYITLLREYIVGMRETPMLKPNSAPKSILTTTIKRRSNQIDQYYYYTTDWLTFMYNYIISINYGFLRVIRLY